MHISATYSLAHTHTHKHTNTHMPTHTNTHKHTHTPPDSTLKDEDWLYGSLNEDGGEKMGGLAVVFLSSLHEKKTKKQPEQDCRRVNGLSY